MDIWNHTFIGTRRQARSYPQTVIETIYVHLICRFVIFWSMSLKEHDKSIMAIK